MLEVDNFFKVFVNILVVYLCWNYIIVGDEEFKEVDFYFGVSKVYIGYISISNYGLIEKFWGRFGLEFLGILIIYNVIVLDIGIYIFYVEIMVVFWYFDVFGKLRILIL